MANKHPTNSFKKGDPRINRKGAPKKFKGLRELALKIAGETIKGRDPEGNTIEMARIELILRSWASGKFNQQQAFVETAFGKVPDEVEINGELDINGDVTVIIDK